MKVSAIEKPGKVLSFRNKYLTLVTVALVFLTSVAHGQIYDSTKTPIPIYNAYRWNGGSFIFSFTLPKDTTRLSIRDVGSLAYKNGQVYLYRVNTTCSCLRWDTLSGGIGGGAGSDSASIGTNGVTLTRVGNVITYKLDTAWVTANYLLNHPFIIKADTAGGIRINGDTISCPGCNVGGDIDSILAAGRVLNVDTVNGLRFLHGTSGDTIKLAYNGGGSGGISALTSEVTASGTGSVAATILKSITPTWTGLHTFSAGLKSAADVLPTTNYGPNVGSGSFIWSNIYSGQSHADLYSPNGGDFKAGGTTNQAALTIFSSGGNVAIHTLGATPTDFGNKLQVNGDALITDSLRVGTIRNSAPGDSVMYVHNNVPRKGLAPSGTVALGAVPVFNIPVPADSIKIQKNLGFYDARTYGYNPDGKLAYDGAITSGANVFVSTSASFVTGDVGKIIHIKGIGASGKDTTLTIAGRTNGTTITLSGNASTTVTAAQYVYGSDMTVPIQNTINATTDGGGGTSYFSAGIAIVNGALQTSIGGQNPNSQIYIKAIPAGNYPATTADISLRILGETPASKEEGALATVNSIVNGTIFYSTLNTSSGTYPSVLGTKGLSDGFGGFFNAVDVNLENITVRTTAGKNSGGPRLSCVNFEWAVNHDVEHARFDIDIPGESSGAPTFPTFGFKTTKTNGGTSVVMNNVISVGHKYGYIVGEHTTGNNIEAMMNEVAIAPTITNHPIHLGRVGAYWNKYTVQPYAPEIGTSVFVVDQLDMELRTDSHWYDNVTTFNDASGNLFGSINYYQLCAGGGSCAFSISGCTNITLVDITRGNLARHQVIGRGGTSTTLPGQNDSTAVLEVHSGLGTSTDTYFPQLVLTNDQTGTSNALAQVNFVNASAGTQKRLAQIYASTDGNINKGLMTFRASDGTNSVDIFNYNTDSFRLFKPFVPHRWSTAGRPASPTTGMIGFNNDSGRVDVRVGGAWKQLANTSDIVSGGGSGSPGGSTTQVQYNNAGSFAGSANLIWDNTNARLGIGGSPSAPLHIIAPIASGYGQFSIQATTGTVGSSAAYMTWRDGAGTRMMVEGFGQYGGSPDLNYYYANEINGSYVWRNSTAQIAELTTAGKLGLGITPAEMLHVYNGSASSKIRVESNDLSSLAGVDFKVGGTSLGTIRGVGSSAGAAPYNNSSLSILGFGAGGTSLGNNNSSGYISLITNNAGTEAERMHMSADGSIKFSTYVPANIISLDTTNNKILVTDASGNMKLSPWQAPGGSSGATSVGTPNATSTANGSDITSGVLTEHYADATNPGIGKLYTTAGTATDGSLTRTAINSIYAPLTSATLVTPTLGVAAATTINKVTITAPATNATLTLAQGSTFQLTGANVFQMITSGVTTVTIPSGVTTMGGLSTAQTWSAANTFSNILTSAGLRVGYVAKTTGYTSTTTDHTINYTTAAVTHTLPTAVSATGQQYTIKNRAASGTVTVATTSSQTIDGNTAATYNLTTQNDWLTVESDGANWMVVGKRIAGETGTGANVLAVSPALTGTPTAPTASVFTNSTQLATTAYSDRSAGFITNVMVTTGTTTLSQIKTNLVELNPATTLASATLAFPAAPNEGDVVIINAGGTIAVASTVVTTLTVSGNGKTLYGAAFPTTVVGGASAMWIYHNSVGWFRQY